jgi:hypothetical protein
VPVNVSGRISTLDFCYEHSLTKVVANRNCQEIKLAGLQVGPYEEGNEYEVYNWLASELEKNGVVHLREDEGLNMAKLNKFQWSERVQSAGQISSLPEHFYPRLREYLASLKKDAARTPQKMLENEKAYQLALDILNSRLRKIVSIASAPAQTEQTLRNLTAEERFLYGQLHTFINHWRTQILEYKGKDE